MTDDEVVASVAAAIVDGTPEAGRRASRRLDRHAADSRRWLELYREAEARATEVEDGRRRSPWTP